MRFSHKIKIGNLVFSGIICNVQKLTGIDSLQPDGKHIIMWDIEGHPLPEIEATLRTIQKKHNLSDIPIFSDKEGSYRAWCFTKVSFQTLLIILAESYRIIDPLFFSYTVKRKKATLRTCNKKDRPPQQLINILQSYPAPIPTRMERVIYDTGIQKKGHLLVLGGERDV